MNIGFFNRKGEKIEIEQFGELFCDPKYKFVAYSTSELHVVSTVWLGLDHGFGTALGEGKPVIFETMVFNNKPPDEEDWSDLETERYCTEEEALVGHRRICEKWGVAPFKFEPAEGQRFQKVIK